MRCVLSLGGFFSRDKKYIIQLYLEIDCAIPTYALNLQMKEWIKQWKDKKN